ncbi:uncharacterized protein B0H64DRAFT_369165 [Chaetomium fimeti]|uniref:Uncharacterized protein n=1 Tax=Chaetomium fimeti TaxID=1854472 RepID=A0AAE0LWC3_9PEZI|nr:hypothetical protein B0H64DRAFT_369165 [Chaetomium fimeti]
MSGTLGQRFRQSPGSYITETVINNVVVNQEFTVSAVMNLPVGRGDQRPEISGCLSLTRASDTGNLVSEHLDRGYASSTVAAESSVVGGNYVMTFTWSDCRIRRADQYRLIFVFDGTLPTGESIRDVNHWSPPFSCNDPTPMVNGV